jgi:hypothetical protein
MMIIMMLITTLDGKRTSRGASSINHGGARDVGKV